MQLLWIGCLESDEEFKRKAKKGYDLASAQVSQKNLVNGIEINTGLQIDSINGSVLPPYPAYADRIVEPVAWHHCEGSYDISVGYKNIKYINRLYCKRSMVNTAKKWVRERYLGGKVNVFVYSMRSAPMATACYIKKAIPKARIYLIVTDLPQFMDLGQSNFKAALKKIDWFSIKRMQKQFDGFILYASKMAEYLKIADDNWILMEGSYDGKVMPQINTWKQKKAIMYSGKLDVQYGIPMLLESFMMIDDPGIELWLTGRGNAEAHIKKCAAKDKRIKFFGFLPSRNDVLKLQQQASLLLNMRLPSEPASAYCFPSKLFEYMVTGIPVLSFKLDGIPKEYHDYLLFMEEESKYAIKSAIEHSMTQENKMGYEIGPKAKSFICSEKNSIKQTKRIIDFVAREDL